jgi:hypothetical protein
MQGAKESFAFRDRDGDSTSPTGKSSLYSEASLLGAVVELYAIYGIAVSAA